MDVASFLNWYAELDHVETEKNRVESFPCVSPATASGHIVSENLCVVGCVTKFFDDHGLIDDYIYFEIDVVEGFDNLERPRIGDKVHVKAERKRSGGGWVASSVKSINDRFQDWTNENPSFKMATSHEARGSVIGLVSSYDAGSQHWFIEESVQFLIADVVGDFVPQVGDWVKANVSKKSEASSVEPLRKKEVVGTVTRSAGDKFGGLVNGEIRFDKLCCPNNPPRYRDTVEVTAIECKQGSYCWRAVKVNVLRRARKGDAKHENMRIEQGGKMSWVLHGEKPEFGCRVKLPSFLPEFGVPQNLRECVESGGDILSLQPTLKELLSSKNFVARFAALLYLEEIAVEHEIKLFEIRNAPLTRHGEYLKLNVPGLEQGKPDLLVGDVVVVNSMDQSRSGEEHHGFIHHILGDTEEVLIKFHIKLYENVRDDHRFVINFRASRTPFRRCQLALIQARKYFFRMLFPTRESLICTPAGDCGTAVIADKRNLLEQNAFVNKNLNDRQKQAVRQIIASEINQLAYVIFGPPGTGKTITLVELIIQLVMTQPSCRLLVCAPSNSAVDTICERLHQSGHVTTQQTVRFNAYRRPADMIEEPVSLYCHQEEDVHTTSRYQILMTTCMNAGAIYTCSLHPEHFTHVIIDEAGQCTEPECLIPIGLSPKGKVILAGDPLQLGPVLKSVYSKHYGLGVSLIERLMQFELYARNDKFCGGYNDLLVTKLTNNYRSHSSLLALPSTTFYHDELEAHADWKVVSSMCEWKYLPNSSVPLIFHGVNGTELREPGSPSFFNPQEVVQVTYYVKRLLEKRSPDEIGIITPYKKQVEKVRMMLKTLKVAGVKVGSVEEFQGKEKMVVIISLVRSSNGEVKGSRSDHFSLLGFVADAKRFNVAITRARALMIIVGCPDVLAKDKYWRLLLQYCIRHGAYVGCDCIAQSEL